MYEKILALPMPETMTKRKFLETLQKMGVEFFSGLDFGFTHNFAAVTGFVFNNTCYIIDCISMPELDVMEKIEVLNDRIKYLKPVLFPDPESPSRNCNT
jgi:hypothetical protein